MSVAEYVNKLLGNEEYSFSIAELLQNSTKSDVALKREVSRLVEKKQLVVIRKGFYLIIPPRYSKFGILPIELFVDKLFNSLQKEYYVAFYSAAKYFGASHQQIQKEYIITALPPIYNIEKESIKINFYNKSNWPNKNIIKRKSDAGYFNISSPALTIADLIFFHSKLGGINRMLAIIEELSESLIKKDIIELLSWYPHKSTIQRIGYLLEEMEVNKSITDSLYNYLKKNAFYPVLLSSKKSEKPGKVDNKWKVDVNIKLESDL